jgi:hypothetical protein
LVIRYGFLWRHEPQAGREEGKDRPCALVVAGLPSEDGEPPRIVVVPITRSRPADPTDAMEIPTVIKAGLGLGGERSWLILSESNIFRWPGPDIRPVLLGPKVAGAYGVLPPRFFAEVKRRFLAIAMSGRNKPVPRTD